MPLASWAKLGIPYWQMGYEKRFTSSDITVLSAILIWVCICTMTCPCFHFRLQQVTEMYITNTSDMPENVLFGSSCPLASMAQVLHHTSPWRRSCVQSSWPGNPAVNGGSGGLHNLCLYFWGTWGERGWQGDEWYIDSSCRDSCNEIKGATMDVLKR